MFLNTNTLFAEAKAIFEGKKAVNDDNPLYRYRFDSESYPGNATKGIDVSISRVWVWHNFKNGYMKVIYSVRYLDENGKIVSCSIGVPSKWYIEKMMVNGKSQRLKNPLEFSTGTFLWKTQQ